MNTVHLHLMLTHVPVLGTFFGLTLLGTAVLLRSSDVTRAGLATLVLSALSAIPAFLTGEGAEHAVEHLAGVGEKVIEAHESAAGVALAALELAGALALATLVLTRIGRAHRALVPATLVVALVAGGLMGYTALLGGRIRHTEIRGAETARGSATRQDD